MIDKAFPVGLIQTIDTDNPEFRSYSLIRKLFQDYLNELKVPYYDECCPLYAYNQQPVRYTKDDKLEYYDVITGEWVEIVLSSGSVEDQDNIMRVIQVTLTQLGMTESNTQTEIKDALAAFIDGMVIPEDEIWYFQVEGFPDLGEFTLNISDTNSIDLSGNGSVGTPLTASLRLDGTTGGGNNILQVGANGVYAAPTVIPTIFTSYEIEEEVGSIDGIALGLTDGSFTFAHPDLAGRNVVVHRNLQKIPNKPWNGNTYYTKNLVDNFITFSDAIQDGELISIQIL